jgi:hypothetical protein
MAILSLILAALVCLSGCGAASAPPARPSLLAFIHEANAACGGYPPKLPVSDECLRYYPFALEFQHNHDQWMKHLRDCDDCKAVTAATRPLCESADADADAISAPSCSEDYARCVKPGSPASACVEWQDCEADRRKGLDARSKVLGRCTAGLDKAEASQSCQLCRAKFEFHHETDVR